MAESFIDEELAAQRMRNERLIELIVENGAALGEERPIDFFFYANSREDALSLARDLEALGFVEVTVPEEPYEDKWAVIGILLASVVAATAERFVESIVRLTAKYLAEFDGWGTPI